MPHNLPLSSTLLRHTPKEFSFLNPLFMNTHPKLKYTCVLLHFKIDRLDSNAGDEIKIRTQLEYTKQ